MLAKGKRNESESERRRLTARGTCCIRAAAATRCAGALALALDAGCAAVHRALGDARCLVYVDCCMLCRSLYKEDKEREEEEREEGEGEGKEQA